MLTQARRDADPETCTAALASAEGIRRRGALRRGNDRRLPAFCTKLLQGPRTPDSGCALVTIRKMMIQMRLSEAQCPGYHNDSRASFSRSVFAAQAAQELACQIPDSSGIPSEGGANGGVRREAGKEEGKKDEGGGGARNETAQC